MERYSRQYFVDKIGVKGQEMLLQSKVVIVGGGALGSRSAELLARAGIGNIIIIDRDRIELSNLQRQALYTEEDIGKAKAIVIEERLKKINSSIQIRGIAESLADVNVDLLESDLVLDCTDNFEARLLINEYCKKKRMPWVYCAAIKTSGAVMSMTPKGGFCFRCVFQKTERPACTSATGGILNSTAAMASSIQVAEAMKILTKQKPSPFLIKFDVWEEDIQKLKVKKDPKCPVCNNQFEFLK